MKTIFYNAVFIDAYHVIKDPIVVNDGIIEYIGKIYDYSKYSEYEIIDFNGHTVLPGFVDMHSHFRDPGFTYKEDISSGLNAAIRGGYTTVCTMANTKPVCDNIEVLKYIADKSRNVNLGRLIPISAIGKNLNDKEIVNIKENMQYTNLFSNDGMPILSDEFMREALIMSKKLGFILFTHCEPENEVIERDIALLKEVGGNLHICHISKKESVEVIKKAKSEGLKFTCEVTPHHIFSYGLEYNVNPPFGNEEDYKTLIEAIKEGLIDIIGTDHAPHSKEDKKSGANGIANIENAFQMCLHKFNEFGLSIHNLSKMISCNPANRIGLNAGLFKEGYYADFVEVDLAFKGIIDKGNFVSKSQNTPFDKSEISGLVLSTYVGGNKKYEYNR